MHYIAWFVKLDVMVLLSHLQALHVVLMSIMGCWCCHASRLSPVKMSHVQAREQYNSGLHSQSAPFEHMSVMHVKCYANTT